VTGYRELVAAATVGLAQRPLSITVLPEPATSHSALLDTDPAAAVLDAAALLDAARRASGPVPASVQLPAPADADTAPELRPVAASIIAGVLRDGPADLLADLLAAAARAGFRAPAPLVPALLSVAVSSTALRPAVAATLGRRGSWLAAQQPDWLRVADAAAVEPGEDAWETGRLAERRAWLAELRRGEPDAARELLAAGWAREAGEDRAELIAVLAAGLSAAYEPFLEAALDDRKADVRRRAAALLARLPGSAYAARARARGTGVLSVERRGLRRRLVVTLPTEPDDAAKRDGLDPRPPDRRVGAKAWVLTQIIAAAPLELWPELLGDDPAGLVRLPVADDFGTDVHAGWRTAALRQRSAEWARALLHAGDAPQPRPGWSSDEALAALLPADERQTRAVQLLRDTGRPGVTEAALQGCPPPWTRPLITALMGFLARGVDTAQPGQIGALLPVAARGLPVDGPVDYAAEFRRLADEAPQTTVLPTAYRRAADILDLRRRFHEELH
jgi:hypothetical protein